MKKLLLTTVSIVFTLGSLLAQHTWLQQETNILNDLQAVSFISENKGIAVGNEGIILTTENGGENWSAIGLGLSVNLFGVDFASENKVLIVGEAGTVLMTENFGQSWDNVTIPGVQYDLLDVAFDRNSGHGVITGQGNAIIVTSDFGNTWTIVQDGYMSTFYSALMASENMGVVIGWNSIFQPLLGYTLDWQTWDFCNFYPTWGGVFYEGRANGGKFVSENEGFVVGVYFVPGGGFLAPFSGWGNNSWETQSFPEPLLDIDMKGQFGVVTGTNGYVAESKDNCQSWEMINTSAGNLQLNDVYLTGNTGYIAGEMGLMLKLTSTVSVPETTTKEIIFNCYPNPCRDVIFVDILNQGNPFRAEIAEVTGKVLSSFNIQDNVPTASFPVHNLASGIYFLKIKQGGITKTLKFAKE